MFRIINIFRLFLRRFQMVSTIECKTRGELLLKIIFNSFQSFSVHVIKCTKTDDLFWMRFSIKKYGCRSRFSLFMNASYENRHFVWVTNLCTGSNRTNRIFLQSYRKPLLLEQSALSIRSNKNSLDFLRFCISSL